MTMQTEVIVPLIGYLLLVFLLSAYAYRKREKGEFLNIVMIKEENSSSFAIL